MRGDSYANAREHVQINPPGREFPRSNPQERAAEAAELAAVAQPSAARKGNQDRKIGAHAVGAPGNTAYHLHYGGGQNSVH